MQQGETVSRRSRHRSNHTQNTIPSVVAGHQFLQFYNIGSDNGSFPITQCDISRLLLWRKTVYFSANFPSVVQNCFFRMSCLPLVTACILGHSSFCRCHPCWLEQLKDFITFPFKRNCCRQPSSQARVTSHKLPASSQHLTGSGCLADWGKLNHFSVLPSPASSSLWKCH